MQASENLPASSVATTADTAPAAPVQPAPSATTAAPEAAAVPAPSAPAADPNAPAARKRPRRRGGQNRQGRKDAAPAASASAGGDGAAPERRPARHHPLLDQLAQWHPQLFGAALLPLKRGIFQDLLDAHPDAIDKDALKLALALHTRSTRYLSVVAQGMARHDLQGQVTEAMAPEHVHHALLEVFRRRQLRSNEDLAPKLRRRIRLAYEASGLARQDYDALVRGRDERANALLDEALAEAAADDARAEALLHAFEASGQDEAGFADMYGMDARQVARQLARARQRRGA